MSASDIHIHLDRDRLDALWGAGYDESEAFPFGEDDAELDAIIEEEMGSSRKSRRRKTPVR